MFFVSAGTIVKYSVFVVCGIWKNRVRYSVPQSDNNPALLYSIIHDKVLNKNDMSTYIYWNIYPSLCKWKCSSIEQDSNIHVSHNIANWQNLIYQPPVAAEGLTRSRTLSRMIANHCFWVCQSSVVTSNTVTSDEVFLINCAHGGQSRVSAIFPAYHVCWLYKCSNWNVKQASRGTIFTQNSSHMVRIAGQLRSIAGAERKKHFENEF